MQPTSSEKAGALPTDTASEIVSRHLQGVHFPCELRQLILEVESLDLDPEFLESLQLLPEPERRFENFEDVVRELNRT